jgi:hypothetical protein
MIGYESNFGWLMAPWRGVPSVRAALGRPFLAVCRRVGLFHAGVRVPRMSETWLRQHDYRSAKSPMR